ncbi:glycosyltransferase family 4 protein [Phenylobacterium sp.]|jgi:phosphatidylinositol alpha-1,6-mannosyltransferase|uniref:glycosyltransferase family 4 protein n=1 Tax=Phenylobacterium sp. TaxID=1871053 RepID=UPI002F419347
MSAAAAGGIVLTCEYPPFPGGIGTYAGELVSELRRAGFKAVAIAPAYPEFPAPDREPDTHRILRHHGITPVSALKVLNVLRSSPRHSILLAADIRSVLLAAILKPLHGRNFRAMIHGSEVSKLQQGGPLFRLATWAYAAADLILANSQATLQLFSASFGSPFESRVTYLGVDHAWFAPQDGGFEHADLAALDPQSAVVCTVGRIEARKGHLESVRILARARDDYGLADPVFVMAGRPEDEAYVAHVLAEAKALGIPAIQTGRLSQADLKRLYRRAACHVLCARELSGKIEGFGLVLLEAAAQDCPSVATRLGGIPEVMGDTGVVLPADDFDGMARAVAVYAADIGTRRRDGAAAKLRAQAFTWAQCARRTFPELWASA